MLSKSENNFNQFNLRIIDSHNSTVVLSHVIPWHNAMNQSIGCLHQSKVCLTKFERADHTQGIEWKLLQKRPDSTSAMLIGHWHGETWGATLSNLLQMDQLIPLDGMEQEFIDTVSMLEEKIKHLDIDQQVDKLATTDYSQMSAEEKEELKQLLSKKHSK